MTWNARCGDCYAALPMPGQPPELGQSPPYWAMWEVLHRHAPDCPVDFVTMTLNYKENAMSKNKDQTTENDPRGTHTGKDGRQDPNNPGPLAEEYKRQTGRY